MSSSASARVHYQKTPIYESLVDEYNVFGSYVDFFVFAASLGFAQGEAVRTGYEGDNEMLWMHIQNTDLYLVVAASIAYQDTNDPEALVKPERQLDILAQYAAAGAEIAEEEFGSIDGDPTDAVVNFLRSSHSDEQQAEEESILQQIRSDFDGDINEGSS